MASLTPITFPSTDEATGHRDIALLAHGHTARVQQSLVPNPKSAPCPR